MSFSMTSLEEEKDVTTVKDSLIRLVTKHSMRSFSRLLRSGRLWICLTIHGTDLFSGFRSGCD